MNSTTIWRKKKINTISFIGYSVILLMGLVFAVTYLFHGGFMPYHAAAAGLKWSQLDVRMQILITALMRVIGGGWLATSLAMFFLLILRIQTVKIMPGVALVIVGLSSLVPTALATIYVTENTEGKPPVYAALSGIAVLALALFFDYRNLKMNKKQQQIQESKKE